MKQGKHYVDSKKLVDRTKLYDSNEALALCCQTAKAKFDETVELHVRLGVDSRHADQQVRGAVVLPNGTGKNVRVVAIAKGDAAKAAEEAGAMMVGDADLVAKIQNEGFIYFDVLVTTPDMMGLVGRLGKILGPRGLMPNPKAGTVTPDVGRAVTEAKAGKIEYRLDKANIIHVPIGKASFGPEKLEENLKVVMDAIVKAKPAAAKGQYIRSATVASTMGPGIKLKAARFSKRQGAFRRSRCCPPGRNAECFPRGSLWNPERPENAPAFFHASAPGRRCPQRRRPAYAAFEGGRTCRP